MRLDFIYVAGPLTVGNPNLNVMIAVEAANKLMDAGLTPFVPHLSYYWHHLHTPREYEDWLEYDFRWITRCDALLRLQGPSPGADREVEFCVNNGIPVFHSIDMILVHNKLAEKQPT